MTYRKEIDGLRAIAVLSVIFYHAKIFGFHSGFIGVDVFFVISGYLISSLILGKLEAGSFSLVEFYERRARRIIPALFLVMLCCVPFAWFWLLPAEYTMFSKSLLAICVFSSNFLFWSETAYFAPANELKPLVHTWSLGVEEQFYLVFPLLFIFAWKWKRRGVLIAVILSIFLSLGVMHQSSLNHPSANFYLAPPRAWEFLIGTLIALLIDSIQSKALNFSPLLGQILAMTGMALLLSSFISFTNHESFPNIFALVPVLGTSLIILFATPRTVIGKLLSSSPLAGMGLISYSAYLWHQPVFVFSLHYRLREPQPRQYGFLIILIIIISYLSWRFVEKPFRNPNVISKKMAVISLSAFTVLFLLLGVLGISQQGYPNRFKQSRAHFDQFFKEVQMLAPTTKYSPLIGMGYNHTTNDFRDTDHFISEWKSHVSDALKNRSPVLAIFGDSHTGNIAKALNYNGISPLVLYGSSCPISPELMNERCKKLAFLMKESIKKTPSIKYLALIRYFKKSRDLELTQIKRTIRFWKDTNVQLLFFSSWPNFPFIKDILQRGGYPEPNFNSSDFSLRAELREYLASEGVHLVNVKEAFCKMTPTCTFKVGDKKSFKPEEMLIFDEHHLSSKGALTLGQILIETDPLLKQIAADNKKQNH